uniref:Uncharacterized protein n=1 Tax=viral metagenome TaxID=1070528 RepID=A0A6C0F571_9ZZZZ
MYMYFSVTEVEELFTTFDYKNLLTAVNTHFKEEARAQGIEVTSTAYYNPGENKGVIVYAYCNEYVYVNNLQHAYGNDFVTIKFNT